MSAFPRASIAFGLAASLMAGASALATEAAQIAAPQPEVVKAEVTSPETQAAVALVSNGVAPKAQTDPSCPAVSIAPEGAARNADGAKATLDGLARDCANLGAETIVKVALVGESERKKEKGAAAFDAPMTIQIRDANGRGVETRRINLKLEMGEGVQRVSFRHVEENVSLPPPTAEGYRNWTIVVGLDPSTEPLETVALAEEEQVEAPAKAKRWGKSRKSRFTRSRSARVKAVNSAKLAATTRAAGQSQVTLSAKSPETPPAIVVTTTSGSGSPMTRVAESSRSIRDKATYERQVQALQQQRAARGLPPVPASAIRRQGAPAPAQPAAAQKRPQQAAARSASAGQVASRTN